MSYLFAQPPALAAAATDLSGIGTAIGAAAAAAAAPTTSLMTAAADDVSAAIADFFGAYGQEFQSVSAKLGTLYQGLVQNLNSTIDYYVNAEAINTAQLRQSVTTGLYQPTAPPAVPAVFNENVAIAMGGTGMTIPTASYLNAVSTLFIGPNVPPPPPAGYTLTGLVTPELL